MHAMYVKYEQIMYVMYVVMYVMYVTVLRPGGPESRQHPISPLRSSPLKLIDSTSPGNSLWT